MYCGHFGLHELPFGMTPDTSYFFHAQGAQAALNTLLVACGSGEGFIKITGEVGSGKTMLCRKFLACLQQDPARYYSAYLPNPMLDPRSLMLALADELGLNLPPRIEQHALFKEINQRLLALAASDKQVILCLDEAQAMPLASLEALRLLTNLETEKRKLLQIVLFGQPELDARLARPEIRQLAQRISFQDQLQALSLPELHAYLAHRLSQAGYAGATLFSTPAVACLHGASKGLPRLVNMLAHKSLLVAFAAGATQISLRHMQQAINDTPASVQQVSTLARLAWRWPALLSWRGERG